MLQSRDLGVAFQTPPGSQALSRGQAKDATLLSSREAAQGAPGDPRRVSRGQRSPWLPLETRPDSPGEPGMPPRDPCLPLRGMLSPGHRPMHAQGLLWWLSGKESACQCRRLGFDHLVRKIPWRGAGGCGLGGGGRGAGGSRPDRGGRRVQDGVSSRDAGLLEPPERPQGSPASSSVWREDPGLLSRPCRKRRPSAREARLERRVASFACPRDKA